MTGAIYLIVESDIDYQIVAKILEQQAIKVRLEPLYPPRGKGGVAWLANNLPDLINAARSNRGQHDCIAVLHDADEQNPQGRDEESHRKIEQLGRQFASDVVRVVAHDEIEAWLLADSGIIQWLGQTAKSYDSSSKPSDILDHWLKKKRQKWPRDVRNVLPHIKGDAHTRSPSLREALRHLEDAPCVQEE